MPYDPNAPHPGRLPVFLVKPDGSEEKLDYIDMVASSSETFGAAGTTLSHITWHPTSTSPGAITVQDGSEVAVTVFVGGAGSIISLDSRTIIEGAQSQHGAWTVTTGANMTARVYYR